MTQHYTKNTTSTRHYCNACKRQTFHRVSDGRLGTCLEHEVKLSKAQELRRKRREEEEKNLRMF